MFSLTHMRRSVRSVLRLQQEQNGKTTKEGGLKETKFPKHQTIAKHEHKGNKFHPSIRVRPLIQFRVTGGNKLIKKVIMPFLIIILNMPHSTFD